MVAQNSGMPPADFGTPPSGEVPILFNDRHVYSKPDRLKQGRVLGALVRGATILIPLRSMFEQMGATVSYDPATRTADVSKPGSDVKVTVGKPEVVINGETRPLDVPPEIYRGAIVVPVRVISEGMGAYVQWVPEKKTVVVRYVAQTPPPPPPPAPTPTPTVRPTTAPTAAPTAPPTPTPAKTAPPEFFVVGDYVFNPKVYNEFSPGNRGGSSYAARAGAEFPLFGAAFYAEGDARQYRYPHRGAPQFDNNGNVGVTQNGTTNFNGFGVPVCSFPNGAAVGSQGCVTTIGGQGQSFVPSFDAKDTDIDGRVGIGIPFPRIFVAGSYIQRWQNYGYPRQQGFGAGLEKLPDFDQVASIYGSFFYYPQVGAGTTLQYRMYKYQVGGTFQVPKGLGIPVFLDFGYLGDRGFNKINAPGGFTHNGAYVGVGLQF